MRRFDIPIAPLLLAIAFFATSLTPSLLPRTWVMQGMLGGLVAALGYMIGRFILMLWRQAQLPMMQGRAATIGHIILAVPVTVLLGLCLSETGDWQNEIRRRMGAKTIEDIDTIAMLATAVATFTVLMIIGFAVKGLFNILRRRLYHYMPERTAGILGLILTALLVFMLTRDGLVDRVISGLDQSFATAQQMFDLAPEKPEVARLGGRPAETVEWESLGKPGRDFVTLGPDAKAISAFTGRPAMDPIRVYVGRAQAETPQDRSDRALAELIAAGGFERSVLIVAMPTGTGWLDPGSHDVVEYMHNGDIATVAVQYSYLQSPMALILETDAGLDQARTLSHTILAHWRTLPHDKRPRLYMHGLSLGAWASMYGTDLFTLLDDPINGAFWAGPPFPSALWKTAVASRNPGSPYVAPVIENSRLFRFATHTEHGGGPTGWGRQRLMYLQYSSDPIVFYEPETLWREPVWMREPPAADVSPSLRFMPIVTQFQLVVDMIFATSAPAGHGHSYYAPDYIGPWRAVTDPPNWTDEDSARLAAYCDAGFQLGCRKK